MTTPTLVSTQIETRSSCGELTVVYAPEEALDTGIDLHALQAVSPAEAFAVRDAVDAAYAQSKDPQGESWVSHFPQETLLGARAKASLAANRAVILSLKEGIIAAAIDPVYASEEVLQDIADRNNDTAPEVVLAAKSDAPDERYVPDFGDEDDPLDPRTTYLVENALNLAGTDVFHKKLNERANDALMAMVKANVAPEKDAAYHDNIANDRARCLGRTIDDLAAAHDPLLLTHRESAFVAAAVRHFDPAAHHAKLAEDLFDHSGLMAEVYDIPAIETDLAVVELPARLGSVTVEEVTGYKTLRQRTAVWAAGVVARASVHGRVGEVFAKTVDALYTRAAIYNSLLLQ